MQLPIWEHLDELRGRLLKVLIAVGITALFAFLASDWLLQWLLKPYPYAQATLSSLKPADSFTQSMRLALIGGFILSFPLFCYQFWSFVAPGLSKAEQKVFLFILYGGTFLFGVGVLFSYFFVVPKALRFFWDYSQHLGVLPNWTIENYLNFILMFLLSFGIAFELPLVLILLVRFRILSARSLAKKRPYIIILLAIVAALLTPPDVVSQLMLLLPLWLLFEFSLVIAKL